MMLSVKQFMAQKLIIEMEHLPYSPDSAPNDFLMFLKVKSVLKGQRVQEFEVIQKLVTKSLKAILQQEFQKYFQQW